MTDEAPSTNHTIGVLAGWPLYDALTTQNFLDSVLRGIHIAAHEYNCHLLIACGLGSARDDDLARPAWPIPAEDNTFIPVGPWNTDGLIVINPLLSAARSAYIQELRKQGHPIVFLGTAEKGSAVALDNEGGIRQALQHLVEHGHRGIAFIAGNRADDAGDSGERLQAYQKFRQKFDLLTDERLIAYGDHTYQGGRVAMHTILASGVGFTAVLASNDESAIGAMNLLHETGYDIPHDIAVIGFDDRPTALAQNPPLTTVHTATFERGYRALEMLVGIFRKHHAVQDNLIINSTSHLIIRHSCGCQPATLFERTLQFTTHPPVSKEQARNTLLNMMARPVLAQARRLDAGTLFGMCRRLLDAFTTSLQNEETTHFQRTLNTVLYEIAKVGEDAHVWQMAITTLVAHVASQEAINKKTKQLVDKMSRWATVTISEHIQRQYRTYTVNQHWLASDVGILNAHLVETTSTEEVYTVLAHYLPKVGIKHTAIAYFEAETAVANARLHLHSIFNPVGKTIHLPAHTFLPTTLLPNGSAHHLALFPLIVDRHQIGFVVFQTENFAICETVIHQIAAALRNARLYHDAREGRRLAEEANQMKSRFLSMVSHELRTPLSLIVGLSEMLLRDQQKGQLTLNMPHARQIERIHTSAQHLDGLIQDVLDLTHGDINQLTFDPEPLHLQTILTTLLSIGRQIATAKGLHWHEDLPNYQLVIYGDRGRLRQIILNLINNAIKFTAAGEISITVTVDATETMVEICITDSGIGVPDAEREAIFEPFHQSQRTAQHEYGGLGLGLAICKHFVHLHGGEIGLYQTAPSASGASFYLRLPIIPITLNTKPLYTPHQQEAAESTTTLDYLSKPIGTAELARALQQHTSPNESEHTILIVDDDVGILEMHTQMIKQHWPRYHIHQAQNGYEALLYMRESPPNLVLLDLMMPELDGFAFLTQMRQEENLCNIPVIVLTAQILTADEMRQLNQGVTTILKKGVFTVAETLTHIHGALTHTEKLSGETRRLIRHAMAYIHEYFAEQITREDIAAHIGVSKGYLSRSFRDELGISPITYLNRYRVNQAKLLLKANQQTITDIAHAVGFVNSGYFSRVFRREVGQSPKTYQKNNVR